ncbi:catenin alpha isoform X2 [Entelurus aequoreus]|uniref:catenin alpha isoform X2 n=1 Tax=Entelurus aequoreus TaxID=161455 RepID=UPI002B1E4EB6|nr:catenin alpha isoform X2 [Entelurus aequoreus]
MSSLLDHSLIRTVAVDQVVAPFACHLCHLVLLCDSLEEPQHFSRLEEAARTVAKATDNMAAVSSRIAGLAEDDVLREEASSMLEPIIVSGQHVLLAAQKLGIQPGLTEHKEELITAAQTVFLGVLKVLLVYDDSEVREVLAAADQVSKRLSDLGSSSDIQSLVKAYQVFSEALLHFSSLTADRADSLKDPRQAKELRDSLEILRRCIPMLHTATLTTIKHPTSKESQAAKSFILDKVQSTVDNIVSTLKSECQRGSLGACGFYTERRNSLLQLLEGWSSMSSHDLNSLVRDLVFHCMAVANSSPRQLQQRLVLHCLHVLHLWSDMKHFLKSAEDHEERLRNIFALLEELLEGLDKAMMAALLHQLLDILLGASSVFEELSKVARQALVEGSSAETDLSFLQSPVEEFISYSDRMIQAACFFSAVAEDAQSLENVENSRVCLMRLRAQIADLSLELADNSMQTLQKLHEICQKWEEGTRQLQDALSDVMDVREFTTLALTEMADEQRGCDDAYRQQNYELFRKHATKLKCHMKLVIQSVRRRLDQSEDPIYRNGLLVLLKQAHICQSKVSQSISDMLVGHSLNVEAYSTFSDNASAAVHHFNVLREGLDGHQHPHLLSPLRESARQPDLSENDSCDLNEDQRLRSLDSSLLKMIDTEHEEEEESDGEIVEPELSCKFEYDLTIEDYSEEPKLTQMPFEFDLLPLLHEVVTVTKDKDVAVLSQVCTGVFELSNCYSQATREALAIMDDIDCKTLESFRAELVSLTPLLVQTAQESAMSSTLSTDSVFRLSTQFSDLINNIRKVLLPGTGLWFHAIYAELRLARLTTANVKKQLNEAMTLCADTVRLLMSSHVTPQSEETLTLLHNKLNKAQNNTRCLVEFQGAPEREVDQLEGLCILWGLSVHILFNSLNRILGTSGNMHQHPQKRLSSLSESSLRIQEAASLTSLACKSVFKSKELTVLQDELKTLSERYLQAAEDLGVTPSVMQLVKSELLERNVIIKMKDLSGILSQANKKYDTELHNLVKMAYLAAEHTEEAEQRFEQSADLIFENVKAATKKVEESLNHMRDSRARSNLRSINDSLCFLMSDIISKVRLMVQTGSVCDTFNLEVKIQCWAAKAHFVVEKISKQDGVHQEAKENIRATMMPDGRIQDVVIASNAKRRAIPSDSNEDPAESKTIAVVKYGSSSAAKNVASGYRDTSSLTSTSFFLKQESTSWDPTDNRIVQETRKMADTLYHMTQYLRNRGPLLNKEAFVCAAKDVMSTCQSVTEFIQVIAKHCLDEQCAQELSLVVEQLLTITNQLSILSSVNAVTPGCKSSDEILVKNVQNLLHTVLRGVHAAETACITGLKQPAPNSAEAEAMALCFQWKRNLELHRAQETSNTQTDDLGLRKTSSHCAAPSLASPVQDGSKLTLQGKGALYCFQKVLTTSDKYK